MSNTNNPFLPHLTEEDNNNNENNNQSNNKAKNNNDILNFLEEGDSSTAAPPPAYEDVVKPQPALPSYNDHYRSYPPPPPAFPVSENYNQIPPYAAPANSNEKSGHRVCCFRASRQNKNCGCGWIIVLMIFIVFGSISVANNNACRNIKLSNLENFSFSTNTTLSTLRINVDNARMRAGEVRIFQGPEIGAPVNIGVYSGSKGATPKYDTSTQNDIFELKISQANGFSIFNIPPRCMRSQINVNLPPDTPATTTNTIQVRNLNIKMDKNTEPYKQNIKLITEDGNIYLNEIRSNAQMNIRTNDGDIAGSIISLSDELSITTDDGDLNGLRLGIAPNTNPKIIVKTNDGDIALQFLPESPFSGDYTIRSIGGRIKVVNGNGPDIFKNYLRGRVGTGGATLNVTSDDGDILVVF